MVVQAYNDWAGSPVFSHFCACWGNLYELSKHNKFCESVSGGYEDGVSSADNKSCSSGIEYLKW